MKRSLAVSGLVLAHSCAHMSAPAPSPTSSDWERLRARVSGRLVSVRPVLEACSSAPASDACREVMREIHNPYFLEDQVGATQSAGWFGAWTPATTGFAVAAQNADDVVAAIDFARSHHMRVVVKGTGHDYLGRSNAPDSLLVWTHAMRDVSVDDAFVPRGCTVPATPAVSLGAGTRWLEAYQEVTVKHHRYVQGGGCTTVGAAGGFLQGGGFGSWSKKYGIAAASLLEAEVVTADGQRRIANACQNTDLFWALRGGGGGTFGVVTRVTLATYPLPEQFGWVSGDIKPANDAAFRELLEHFAAFYRTALSNEHWGEQVAVRHDSLHVGLAFEGMSAHDAEEVWRPFRAWVESQPEKFTIQLRYDEVPGTMMWSYDLVHRYAPDAVRSDDRPGEPASHFYWSDDRDQVHAYWYSYQSRWIPLSLFDEPSKFAQTMFDASRSWSVALHFNKGQAGASPEATERGRRTAMNPAVFDAAALAIVAASGDEAPGASGHELDTAKAKAAAAAVSSAMRVVRAATPGSGSYVNETDYFEPSWQTSFWGENYARLLAIKREYDPDRMFRCHHCVGSEQE